MATLTGVTGNTAEVTTQMKGLFTGLLKPTESMSKLMQKYGYENGQAMIKAEGMQGVLKILQKETGGQSNKMAQLFSNSRALTAALALTGSQYETFKEKTAKMGKAQGSTEKALQDMQTSMSKLRKTINVVKNSLTVFGSAVLQVVVPPATKAANKLSELTDRFSKLSPETQKFIDESSIDCSGSWSGDRDYRETNTRSWCAVLECRKNDKNCPRGRKFCFFNYSGWKNCFNFDRNCNCCSFGIQKLE